MSSQDNFRSTIEGNDPVRTSIVLPTYNESGGIRSLIEELLDVFGQSQANGYAPVEVIIVDDGSTDGTREISQELSESIPGVMAIHLQRNFGKSAALAAGIDRSSGEWIVTMDGDGQDDPEEILPLLAELTDGYDCVSGWRNERQDSLSKTIPSAIQTRLAWLTGPTIHDFVCGLKAYRAAALKDIKVYGEGHRYIPAKLHKRGYRITERPVHHRSRTHGTSKYGSERFIKGFVDLVFHALWNRYSARPLHFLGGAGFVLFALGALIGVLEAVSTLLFDLSAGLEAAGFVSTLALTLFGVQLFVFGFIAEMVVKLQLETDLPYRIEAVYGHSDRSVPTDERRDDTRERAHQPLSRS